jgi:hypothetical protein
VRVEEGFTALIGLGTTLQSDGVWVFEAPPPPTDDDILATSSVWRRNSFI